MLNNVIVPVHHPERAVGPDFPVDRRSPLIIAGGEVPSVVRDEIRAATLQVKLPEQVAGRLGHELHAVPILFGKGARGSQGFVHAAFPGQPQCQAQQEFFRHLERVGEPTELAAASAEPGWGAA